MKPKSLRAKTKVWRVPDLDLELLHAEHQTQSFPRHTHERYAVGVIEAGALGFHYRGENVVASTGDISLCVPGEAHTGQPAVNEGWTYRMFYVETSWLETLTSEIADKPRSLPFFRSGVIADVALARQLRTLHIRLEDAADLETRARNYPLRRADATHRALRRRASPDTPHRARTTRRYAGEALLRAPLR